MAVGKTSLHPCLGWGNACDPRAVQLQTSHLDDTTAKSKEFQQALRLLLFHSSPSREADPSSLSVPILPSPSPHIPTSSSDGHSKPKGRKTVFGCVYLWAEGREGRDLSQGTQTGVRAGQQLFPSREGTTGVTLALCEAPEALAGLLPTRNMAKCAATNSCTSPTPLCLLPQRSTGQLQLIQGLLSPPSCSLPPSLLPHASSSWGGHSCVPRGSGSPFLLFPSPWHTGSRALTSSSSDLLSQIGPVLGRTCRDLPPAPRAFEGSHVGSCTPQTLVGKSHKPVSHLAPSSPWRFLFPLSVGQDSRNPFPKTPGRAGFWARSGSRS